MSLSIGIVGLPNVGKSTLFEALTKKQVDRANYPFCTIDPNVGVVAVPDERADRLAELTKSAKKIYATVEFVDIAGLVKGAAQGEGLGNKFLANIRETDSIVYVLRAFKNERIINTQDAVDVLAAKEILDAEMALKDLATAEKRIDEVQREAKNGKKGAVHELAVLSKVKEYLVLGQTLFDKTWDEEEKRIIKSYQFLTSKPRLYLFNGMPEEIPAETKELFDKNQWPYLIIDVVSEFETGGMSAEERLALGLSEKSGLDELIKASYRLLGLVTFFTTGPDETRAWTVRQGDKAPRAGGVIHSDFESHFIKAEAINWQELVAAGGFSRAREKGLIRTEGKEYVVCEGDVIEIKSNA